jgi:hypothetical protein
MKNIISSKKTNTYNLRKRSKLNNIENLIHESNLLKIPLEEIILLDKPTNNFSNLVTIWLIKKNINALNNIEHFNLRHFLELPLNRDIDYLYTKKLPSELLYKYLLSDIIIYLWRHNISVNKNYELVNKNGNIVEIESF